MSPENDQVDVALFDGSFEMGEDVSLFDSSIRRYAGEICQQLTAADLVPFLFGLQHGWPRGRLGHWVHHRSTHMQGNDARIVMLSYRLGDGNGAGGRGRKVGCE